MGEYRDSSLSKVILQNQWRSPPGGTYRHVVDHYRDHFEKLKKESSTAITPKDIPSVLATPTCSVIHLQTDASKPNALTFLAPLSTETDPLAALELLRAIIDNITEYTVPTSLLSSSTGVTLKPVLTEDAIKDHFDVVYQLLEEMIDGSSGHPFTTEPNALKEVVIPPSILSKVMDAAGMPGMSTLPSGHNMGGGIPWRKSGVRYTNNEIYFDIIEEMDALLEKNGAVKRLSVFGKMVSSCHLSGTPDLLLSFNQPRIVQDVSFHPCVRYSKWQRESVISFVPPDGTFELATYRPAMASTLAASSNNLIPLTLKPAISLEGAIGKFSVSVLLRNTGGRPLEDLVVTLPLPHTTSGCNVSMCNGGNFYYDVKSQSLIWEIGKLDTRDKAPMIQGTFTLPDEEDAVLPHYLAVSFQMSGYLLSGLKVDMLKLQNENYKPYKGVKTVTRSGRFEVRY